MKVASALATLIFIGLVIRYLCAYGGEWEFSLRGIPLPALSADGSTYRNGSEIDDISRGLIRSGLYEVYMGAMLGIVAFCVGAIVFDRSPFGRPARRAKLLKRSSDLLETALRLRNAGEHDRADEALEAGQRLLEKALGHSLRG
jgi:hypothetical protein